MNSTTKVDLYAVAANIEMLAKEGNSRETVAEMLNSNGYAQPTGEPWTATAISYLAPLFGGFTFRRGRPVKAKTAIFEAV